MGVGVVRVPCYYMQVGSYTSERHLTALHADGHRVGRLAPRLGGFLAAEVLLVAIGRFLGGALWREINQ